MEPFWENAYKDKEALSTFSNGKLSSDILDMALKLDHGSSIPDIGCGDGRN